MALSNDTSRPIYGSNTPLTTIPLKAGQKLYKGSIVTVLNGVAYNGTNSNQNHVCVGVAAYPADATNATGDGLANGGLDCVVQPGTMGDFTSGASADAVTFANRLATVYVIDDDTLGLTSGSSTRCAAGFCYEIADDELSIVCQFTEIQS